MKSGNLNFLEPSGPLQACNGTALPLPFTPLCDTLIIKAIKIFVESYSWRMKTLCPTWPVSGTAASRLLLKMHLNWYFSLLSGIFSRTSYVGSTVYFTVSCFTCHFRLNSDGYVVTIIFLEFKYFRCRPSCIVYACQLFVLSSNIMSAVICCQLSGLIQSNICTFNVL